MASQTKTKDIAFYVSNAVRFKNNKVRIGDEDKKCNSEDEKEDPQATQNRESVTKLPTLKKPVYWRTNDRGHPDQPSSDRDRNYSSDETNKYRVVNIGHNSTEAGEWKHIPSVSIPTVRRADITTYVGTSAAGEKNKINR
ncbi:uncharacterized protein LOC109613888 [Musca domestica]|uniref:Uncharacterized protein LOC109613888 n=1 Tax=Musca domestica TaxID=7370 RepID=A0A9J7DKE2_MUSDO|nr:uncharacterized protein LOC109613888 [Musca domestica]